MVTHTHLIFFDAKILQPFDTKFFPVREPFKVSIRYTEELQLHLLKFTSTERKVTRCDLISERFTNLTNTKRYFFTGCSLYIFKVYKNSLCCLRAKIYGVFRIFGYTLEGLEHQIELTDLGKIVFSTSRTWYGMLFDKAFHLFLVPSVHGTIQFYIVFFCKCFDQLIGTKSLMTFFTIHQRIGKAAQVSGCYPCLWVHQNRTVHTNIVFILLNKLLPPGFLNIVFQLDTKISVVPCICQSTINLRTRINKSASFCQSYDFFHCLFHSYPPIRCRMHLL